jgi:hypothetical protein
MKFAHYCLLLVLAGFSETGRADDEIPLYEHQRNELFERATNSPLLIQLLAHQLLYQPLTAPNCGEKYISLHSGVTPTCFDLDQNSDGLLLIQTYCRIGGGQRHIRVEVCVDSARNVLPITVRSEESRMP